jgi:hypothetical protein
MPRCKAPEVLRREAYLAYVDRRRTRETPQMGVFDALSRFAERPGKERSIHDCATWRDAPPVTRLSVRRMELALPRPANRANPIFGKFLEGRPRRDPAIGVPFLGIVDVTANSAFVFFHSRYPFQNKSGEVWGREPVDHVRVNPVGKPISCRHEFIPETYGKHKAPGSRSEERGPRSIEKSSNLAPRSSILHFWHSGQKNVLRPAITIRRIAHRHVMQGSPFLP